MAPPPLRRAGASQVPSHAVTEDTPADMLTGQMNLSVLLPDGRHCRMNVDRGTPMMDLLIQVATANKISPGGHVIQVISDRSHSCLSYKPSTPIGTLDTTALRIVPKNKINELPSRRTKPPPQNPMADAKIRIKVYLPRNQLSAMRVSPKTPLAEVLDQICKDKNLDVSRYELRHPVNVDERLRPSCCLADYKLQEVTVVPLNSRTNTVLSSADIIAMQKKSDGKRKIFAIFGKKSKPSVIESTASSDSLGERSVSPDGSDESADRPRSLSPQPPQVIQAPPRAKKRAAPKPPQINGSGGGPGGPPPVAAPAPAPAPVAARPPSELSEGAESVESRQSSDSSGYHEAGLSDAPDSPTERAPVSSAPSNLGTVSSYSTSNLSSNLTQVNSTSTVSLSSAIRKRRAPPPPAIPRIAEDPQSPPTRTERSSAPGPPAAAAASVASPPVEQQSQQSQQSQQQSQSPEEAESKSGSSPGSPSSSPERTRLKAPLRQDSGTSSTETLTADNPAPAQTQAPAPETSRQSAPPVIEQPETATKRETVVQSETAVQSVSQSETSVQSVDQSEPPPKDELGSGGEVAAKVEPEDRPVLNGTTAAEMVSTPVTETLASVKETEPKPSEAMAVERKPEPTVQSVPPIENRVPVAEKVQTEESAPASSSEATMEESLPKEVTSAVHEAAPAAAPATERTADVLEKPAAAVSEPPPPTVTETSAPVILEAPAAIAATPSPAPESPAAPAVGSETLPTEPRQRAPSTSPSPSPALVPASSDPSSPEPARSTDDEDSETVRLQREVDSALACLDSNLDEALAETAAFTESGSLPTESRRLPQPEPQPEPQPDHQPEPQPQRQSQPQTETKVETVAEETLPALVRETPKAVSEAPKVVQETPKESPKVVEKPKLVPTARETVQEAREVIETLLPVARSPPALPPAVSESSQDKETAVVADTGPKSPPSPAGQESSLSETPRTAVKSAERATGPARRHIPKLGPATRQHPVEVHEEVVERVEKVQRNRMTSKDIKLHIERKLASFDQQPRSSSQAGQLISPPPSAPTEPPSWEYRLPAPPTPFQDQTAPAGRPLEAPLEFQDNMTVTSSEPSEVGDLAEATNAPLVERVDQSEPVLPPADQSEPLMNNTDQSEPAARGADQSDGAPRPAKPERRRSSERLSRQMSFSIGAYTQREPTTTEGGSAGRLQKADSFHYQKSAAKTPSGGEPSSADPPERTARRPVTRRRSSDAADRPPASRAQRGAETEPIRPPRRYEMKFNSSKSYSMLNLSNGGLTMPTERTSSNMNKTQSQTDLAIESEVSDIQSEFLKLQRQFLHWQQQLLQNQSILQSQVAPLAARPAAASQSSLEVRRPASPQPPPPGSREGPRSRRPAPQPPEGLRTLSDATPVPSTACSTSAAPAAHGMPSSAVLQERDVSSAPLSSQHSTCMAESPKRSTSLVDPPKPSTSLAEPPKRSTSLGDPPKPSNSLAEPPEPSTSQTVPPKPSTSQTVPVKPSTSSAVSPALSTPPSPVSSAAVVRVTPLSSAITVGSVRTTTEPSARDRRRTPSAVPTQLGPDRLATRRRQVIEELRRRVPEQEADSEPAAPDYAGRSQSLPRGAGLQHAKLSLPETLGQQDHQQDHQQGQHQKQPSEERTPPRQRAATLERGPESQPNTEPETARQRASTLEKKSSETREKRVPWSPPKVALGTWTDQSRQSQVQLKEDRDYVLRQSAPTQERRPGPVSVRPTKSVTVTSLGAPPPPVGVPPAPQPQVNGTGQPRLSAVAKVRHNETVSAPTAVLPPSARSGSSRQTPAFSISDSKPVQPGRSGAAAGRFTSVVSLTEEPRQPHTVSVQVSKSTARAAATPAAAPPTTRPAARQTEPAAVTCRVAPPAQQSQSQRTAPSVVSVTRKDSATATEPAATEAAWRNRHQPVVKGFRQPEVSAPVPPPPPPPAPVLPSAAAGRARLKPVSAGRPAVPKLDPREELMIAIREHGGLKKRGGVRP